MNQRKRGHYLIYGILVYLNCSKSSKNRYACLNLFVIEISYNIVVKSPIGAEKRKQLEKRRRKKTGKERELKEQRKSKPRLAQNIIAAPTAGFEANALEGVATAEDERKFQQDIVKIREMEKRAGFGTTEDSGDGSSIHPVSKKAKRKEKKKQLDGTHKGNEVPAHTPSCAPGTTTTSV
ncbi:hypothetical protein H4R20_003569 [Coemansia guatemalensis]|uniref:Uncharacterized protein n=1 Tax=Coemansia guatemalensis TaxID=2761395 RepID=A0A9W8LRA1_9FUNG|nr:hypothetical protein H4R20_003569 [Coemansia guatemalensis]